MQNMPSVQNQMQSGAPQPLPGTGVQKERAPLSVRDADGSSVPSSFPETLHNALQQRLHVREEVQQHSGSAGIEIREGMPVGDEKGLTAPTGKANPQDVTEDERLAHAHRRIGRRQGAVSGETPDGPPSGRPDIGEQAVAAGEKSVLHGRSVKTGRGESKEARRSGDIRGDDGGVHDRERGHQTEMDGRADGVEAAFNKVGSTLESGHWHREEDSAANEAIDGLYRESAPGETEGRGEAGLSVFSSAENGSSRRMLRAVTGTKASPLTHAAVPADAAAPQSPGSADGEKTVSPGQEEGAFNKVNGAFRSGHRHTGENPAVNETIDGLYGGTAPGEVKGRGEAGASALSSPEAGPDRGMLRAAPGTKASPLPQNAAVSVAAAAPESPDSADGEKTVSPGEEQGVSEKPQSHLRAGHRHTPDMPGAAEERRGDRGSAVGADEGGSGDAGRSADVRDIAGRAPGFEAGRQRREEENAQGLSGFTPVKDIPGERLHNTRTVEKTITPRGDVTFQAVDGVPVSASSDDGEGIHRPGRQPEFLGQVVENTRTLMQQGGGRVLISLNPPRLGALDIDVRVTKDGIELYMVANSQDVKHTLYSHVEQLRSALGDQGLNMDRFLVVVGDRPDGQAGRDPRQGGMTGGQWETRNDQGYLPGGDRDARDDEARKAALLSHSPSVGVINVFI